MRILLTGACGYVGSVLLPKLLAAGHYVEAIDLQWFGNHTGMPIDKADFRDFPINNIDAVIHLAAVANDPTGDLDPALTWKTNALGTMQLADAASRAGVKQFIYASSGSVYGVNDAPMVTEEMPLKPISAYNETKMVAERCLLSYKDKMLVQIVRPATVCGLSPRMRLDVAVNMLTMQALSKGMITVLGGSQYRPHIHIEDMTDLYLFMLAHPELIGVFNAGFENMPMIELADRISKRTRASVQISASNDPRSYRLCSDKLISSAGFKPKRTVQMAVAEMTAAYHAGTLVESDQCHNIRTMKLFV